MDEYVKNFVETHYDRNLTSAEKSRMKRTLKATRKDKLKMSKGPNSISVKGNAVRNTFFRYAMMMFAGIVLCLAVVLPITLGNSKNIYIEVPGETPPPIIIDKTKPTPPPIVITPEQKPYTNTSTKVLIDEVDMREHAEKYNLLLFSETQTFDPWEGKRTWGNAKVEYADDAPTVLSYVIDEQEIYINEGAEELSGQSFKISYRIRTYKNYEFSGYYPYSVLEKAYNEGEFSFSVNDVKVCYSFESNFAGDFVFIYFIYEGYEYFIEIEDIWLEGCLSDSNYIKDVFMKELLK